MAGKSNTATAIVRFPSGLGYAISARRPSV